MPKMPSVFRELGMKKSTMIAAGVYFSIMITSIVVTLYFRLIPPEQMGIRLDTLPMGIAIGIACQLPMFLLVIVQTRGIRSERDKIFGITAETFSKLLKHARVHATYAVFDAPVAESFWSGIVLSSLVAYLTFLGLEPLLASILGIIVGTGIHIIAHCGPLRPLFGEGAPLYGVFIVMALNRTAFIVTNNLIAPILGHFLFANYILLAWRIAKKS